jgi:hypothetical protein
MEMRGKGGMLHTAPEASRKWACTEQRRLKAEPGPGREKIETEPSLKVEAQRRLVGSKAWERREAVGVGGATSVSAGSGCGEKERESNGRWGTCAS